jgi:hypothetical protein
VSALRGIVLAFRFACELAMVVALGFWGFEVVDGTPAVLLGIGAPAVAVAIWGAFVAPKARWPASIRVRLAIEFALFGAAVAGLVAADQPLLAALLAVAAGITSILNAATAGDETRSVA